MDSRQFIDAQFDRAVQIVQGLPKTGPIQTGYEEKLAMYSLYKQATVGNVKGPRPPIWDMLGRAKWDAWAKHKDLEPYEAKWLYVDALLRVLRKYSDKTVARDMVKEIEGIGGGAADAVNSSYSRSHGSDSDSTSPSVRNVPTPVRTSLQLSDSKQRDLQQQLTRAAVTQDPTTSEEEAADAEDETDEEDKENAQPGSVRTFHTAHQSIAPRPISSMSTSRYRTPGLALSPTPQTQTFISPYSGAQQLNTMSQQSQSTQSHPYAHVPSVQPLPSYDTPSAFPGPSSAAASSTSMLGSSYAHAYPSNTYISPRQSVVNQQAQSSAHNISVIPAISTGALSPVERAVANVQAHIAALQERIESLETSLASTSQSRPLRWSLPPSRKPGDSFNQGSHRFPFGGSSSPWNIFDWYLDADWESEVDFAHMGMWSLALSPVVRLFRFFVRVLRFVLHRDSAQTPTRAIVRRLLLDVSFILCAIAVTKYAWAKSGGRRKEVVWALRALWGAVMGSDSRPPRILVDRGV